jgi:nicotinamide-nucleotide amidase
LNIEIINTGSELMLGRVLNTHQHWLCRQLANLGYTVARQIAVGDTGSEIQAAVREALGHADLILCTGGLGPTSDDLTRDCLAALLGRKLEMDPAILAQLERFYAERGRPMPPSTRVQAMVPAGSLVLPNAFGTAPGLAIEVTPNAFRQAGRTSWVIMLPGPPRELYPMFTQQVVPFLREKCPLDQPFAFRILRTTGFGESILEEKLAEPLKPFVEAGLDLGYCARVGEVELRLGARGNGVPGLLDRAEAIVRELIGPCIFGTDEQRLEEVVVQLLTERKQTLATAESCTGGLIAHRVTNVSGASAVFMAGLVTYSNEAKQRLLEVPASILEAHGAVSEATARAMAEGARRLNRVDYALSVTGIAGPTGGTEAKPVGTVFLSLASARGTTVQRQLNRLDRESFKQATAQQALEMLRQALLRA